ncbi:hypothetical protein K523DRAFT_138149 [Schizophyllum commune Tattone D]|nr:hypothetical protein K523DRAFT_138149 [Schizophyllum commune Tattone D]
MVDALHRRSRRWRRPVLKLQRSMQEVRASLTRTQLLATHCLTWSIDCCACTCFCGRYVLELALTLLLWSINYLRRAGHKGLTHLGDDQPSE